MKKLLTTILAIALFSMGCTACDPKPEPTNPCDSMDCGSGTCVADGDSAACNCNENQYGEHCELYFSADDYMAYGEFCQSDSGRVEIAGQTGQYAGYNGYYVEVPAGTFSECVWVLMTPALGISLPDPDSDRIVSQAHGIELLAISQTEPYLPNGEFNEVQPLNDVDIHFAGHRGRVLLFKEVQNTFEPMVTRILATGTLGKTTHFSPFYLLDGDPTITADASDVGNGDVEFNFSGTLDEQSATPFFLSFSAALEDGTPLTLTAVTGETHKFIATLPGGLHSLTATVTDPYGNSDAVSVDVTVDLCTGNTCEAWQTCREIDGVCIGDDPCDPSPCNNGTCDNSTGSAVCTCDCDSDFCWSGSACDTCAVDFTGTDCHRDWCADNTCTNGTCESEACSCPQGWTGTLCDTCDIGYIGSDCHADWCESNTCQNGGVCTAEACDCSGTGGYSGTYCEVAPVPTITGLAIDCSADGGWCLALGATYPISFTSTNTTSWSATVEKTSTGAGTAGSLNPESGTISGSPTTFNYTTGSNTMTDIRITVTVTGPGGSGVATLDFTIW